MPERTRSPLISPEVLAVVRAAGYLVIDPDDTAALQHIGHALVHPQEYVPREPFEPGSPWPESKTAWRRRAVIAALTKQGAQP